MKDVTTVQTVDIDSLDEFFGTDADTVIVPEDKTKRTILSQDEEISLDPKDLEQTDPVVTTPAAGTETTPAATTTTTTENDNDLSFDELVENNETENKKIGKPKTDKSGIVELFKKKIEAGAMVPFDDYKEDGDLGEYLSGLSMKDLEELWDANETRRTQEVEQKVPQEFFEALPKELQFAAKYVADGGTNLKELFKALSNVEEVKSLDPEKDGREINYQYLKATGFGTEDEIQEQLNEWEDLGATNKKASTFKPKLDKMQEQIVQQQLAEQEVKKQERAAAAQRYVDNVTTALKEPVIAGIKVDAKTHHFLTQGLLNPVYPTISGKPTNLLGHLLEKHQVVEPNYQLVAEALWLLSDPEGYRKKMGEQFATKKTETIVRELKTEYSRKSGASGSEVKLKTDPVKTVPRPTSVLKR